MEIKDININEIELLENIRQKPIEDDLHELMASIKNSGLLQPIGVKRVKGGYILIWGFRRLTACKKLGWKTIPAIIFLEEDDSMSEEKFLILNASENIHRKSTNYAELGRVCSILRKTMSPSEIAVNLNISKAKVEEAIAHFKRIPEQLRSKIIGFGSSRQEKRGFLSASIASAIMHLGETSDADKTSIYEWARKEEKSNEQIRVLSILLKGGLPLKRAIKECDNYIVKQISFIINKEELKEKIGIREWFFGVTVKEMIREKYPNLLFKQILSERKIPTNH